MDAEEGGAAEAGGTAADETKRGGTSARSPMKNVLKIMARDGEKGQGSRECGRLRGDG